MSRLAEQATLHQLDTDGFGADGDFASSRGGLDHYGVEKTSPTNGDNCPEAFSKAPAKPLGVLGQSLVDNDLES